MQGAQAREASEAVVDDPPVALAPWRRLLAGVSARVGLHRRLLLAVLGLALFFYVVGHFATPATTSGMCLIYG